MREHTGKGVKLGGGGAWLRCGGGQGRPSAALCNIVDFTACFQFICPIVCVCIAAAAATTSESKSTMARVMMT